MNFLSLSIKFLRDEFYAVPVDRKIDYYNLFKGSHSTQTPIQFQQSGGRAMYDFVNGGFSLILISENVMTLLDENKITGWASYPIILLDNKLKEIKGYHGLSITGRCGKIHHERSELIERRNINNDAYKIRKGLFFEPSSWDGSDMFSPDESMFIFVSGKVHSVLEKCTNVNFENTEDVETLLH